MKPIRALRNDRWLLALGVVAVLVHLFASQFMAHAMPDPSVADFSPALCTSQGLSTPPAGMQAGADPTPAGDTFPNHGAQCCDLCGSCAPLTPADKAGGGRSGHAETVRALPPAENPGTSPAHSPQNPRGPPLFS